MPGRLVLCVFSSIVAAFAVACADGATADSRHQSEPSEPAAETPWQPDRGGPNFPEAVPDKDAGPTVDPDKTKDAGPFPPPVTPAAKPSPGEVLITEVMYDPSGIEPVNEWLEVHNTTTSARTLSGLTLVDGANRKHVIGDGVTVAADGYVVIARSRASAVAAKVPPETIVYEYGIGLDDSSGVQLSNNSTGKISLVDGASTIATASYGGWFSAAAGRSIQLKTLTFAAGSTSSSWCLASKTWATGSDKGTPGRANDCP